MAMKLCRSGLLAAATEAGQFTEAPLFGGAALFIEEEWWLDGERWLDGEQWWAGATMAAAIVIRTINIAAQAATMAAEFIEGARSSEGALLCEGAQCVGGARMSPIVVIVVVDADGNTTEGADGSVGKKRPPNFRGLNDRRPSLTGVRMHRSEHAGLLQCDTSLSVPIDRRATQAPS